MPADDSVMQGTRPSLDMILYVQNISCSAYDGLKLTHSTYLKILYQYALQIFMKKIKILIGGCTYFIPIYYQFLYLDLHDSILVESCDYNIQL